MHKSLFFVCCGRFAELPALPTLSLFSAAIAGRFVPFALKSAHTHRHTAHTHTCAEVLKWLLLTCSFNFFTAPWIYFRHLLTLTFIDSFCLCRTRLRSQSTLLFWQPTKTRAKASADFDVDVDVDANALRPNDRRQPMPNTFLLPPASTLATPHAHNLPRASLGCLGPPWTLVGIQIKVKKRWVIKKRCPLSSLNVAQSAVLSAAPHALSTLCVRAAGISALLSPCHCAKCELPKGKLELNTATEGNKVAKYILDILD